MMYQQCPYCGSNLDHGERCDCQERAETTAENPPEMLRADGEGANYAKK